MQLGHHLVPVTPISLVTKDGSLYRALRQYKSGDPTVARNQVRALSALVALFVRRHLTCLAPDGVDTVLVVPSVDRNRPPPHPLLTVLDGLPGVPHASTMLRAGPGSPSHRSPAIDGYVCTTPVEGRRILLVDDTYTTGAHLQSAAHALGEAGVAAVHPLVIGRYIQPSWPASEPIMAWANQHGWTPDRCVHCTPR